ncbi:AAA family ATPase [Gemmatimonadota bacterium]
MTLRSNIRRLLGADGAPIQTSKQLSRTAPVRLLSVAEIGNLPAPEWLVNRYLLKKSLAVLYGMPAAGKTFLGLDWALSVATGTCWLGHKVKPGPTVYIMAEGALGLDRRIDAWKHNHDIMEIDSFFAVEEPVQLIGKRAGSDLLAAIDKSLIDKRLAEPPALIVFDTLARCFVGGDENSSRDMGQVFETADRLRDATGATILLVHHSDKQGKQERGSSALRGAADTMFHLTKTNKVCLKLKCSKQKDETTGQQLLLRLVSVGDSCALRTTVVSQGSGAGIKVKAKEALLALRSTFPAAAVSNMEWRDASGMPERTFRRAKKELVDSGYVRQQSGSGLYELTDQGKLLANKPGLSSSSGLTQATSSAARPATPL